MGRRSSRAEHQQTMGQSSATLDYQRRVPTCSSGAPQNERKLKESELGALRGDASVPACQLATDHTQFRECFRTGEHMRQHGQARPLFRISG